MSENDLPDNFEYTEDGAITMRDKSAWEKLVGVCRTVLWPPFVALYIFAIIGYLIAGIAGQVVFMLLWWLLLIYGTRYWYRRAR